MKKIITYCPKCGRQVSNDVNICPFCEQNISQNKIQTIQAYRQSKQNDKSKTITLVLVLILVLIFLSIAIAATVYVYVSGMFGGVTNEVPDISFNKEITPTSGLRILRVDANILWDDLSISGGSAPETGNVAYIDVGEFVKLNTGETSITISYKPINTLLGYWNWEN